MQHVVVDSAGNMHSGSQVPDGHIRRCRFSEEVVRTLRQRYLENKYPEKSVIGAISTATSLSNKQVRDWFKNKRNREPKTQDISSQTAETLPNSVERGRTAQHRHLSSSNSCTSITLSATQSSDSMFHESSRTGQKRKLREHSCSRDHRERIGRHSSEVESTQEPTVIYQCTVCHAEFSSAFAWKRHEESMCLSQRLWSCLGRGWSILTEESGGQSQICVFCSITEPQEGHVHTCSHRIAECLARPPEARNFSRKDYLKRHLADFHQANLSERILDKWESSTEQNSIEHSWECGFCGEELQGWQVRATHIPKHFREGLSISAWGTFKRVPLQSLSIGEWSFVTTPGLTAFSLTYIPSNGLITYTMTLASGKFSLQYFVGDIDNIEMDDPDKDSWYKDEEEAFIVELRKAPRFYFHPTDAAHSQQCGDFTESNQATAYLAHVLVALRSSPFASLMRDIQGHRYNASTPSITEDRIISSPSSILLGSNLSRFCPFCYMSFPHGCGKLSHSMYMACSNCGKKNWNGHQCMPLPGHNRTSTFVCNATLNGGRAWGCGARFNDYISLWLHLSVEPSGAACRRAIVEESQHERDQELADMFDKKLRLVNDQDQRRSQTPDISSTVTAIKHPQPDSEPLQAQPLASRLIFPSESHTSVHELNESAPIRGADSTGQFCNWIAVSPEAIGVSPAESGETVSSGKSFDELWLEEDLD
jgi:hypothetical protein